MRASDRKDAVESLSARDADTPAQSARKAHEDGLESAHLPLTNLSHMDLKRRIEENLENLRRTVNEVREEKDELLDEVESVLLEFKQIALLNKDIAVETLEEQQQSSSVAELTYRVNQQRKNIEAIETDIKHMDSALLITKNMKHASYMKGRSRFEHFCSPRSADLPSFEPSITPDTWVTQASVETWARAWHCGARSCWKKSGRSVCLFSI